MLRGFVLRNGLEFERGKLYRSHDARVARVHIGVGVWHAIWNAPSSFKFQVCPLTERNVPIVGPGAITLIRTTSLTAFKLRPAADRPEWL